MEKVTNKREIWGWALYDWVNSAFTTIILTFVFGAYFTGMVAPDPVSGTSWWSFALSLSGFGLCVLGPVCGAIADRTGNLKRWTGSMTLLCVIATLIMGLAVPMSPSATIMVVLAALVIANIAFELSIVFNNAMLPQVASADRMGKVSNLAWGLGYLGGLVCLALVLFGLIGMLGLPPLIDLPRENGEHIRFGVIIVFVWYLLFSLPLFLWVKEKRVLLPERAGDTVMTSLKRAWQVLRTDKVWRRFLIGSALYRDGLTTLFSMGGAYAAARYGLEMTDILMFGIGMNVTAGIGCLIAAFLEDKIGSLRMVRWSLMALILIGLVVLWAPGKMEFFASALTLGFFIGPVQSASRTLVARMSLPENMTEAYGLYALTGRSVAFLGPLAFGLALSYSGSQAAGMATIIGFWFIGWLLIRKLTTART